MGKIFYIMGKSATGKDTIYEELLSKQDLNLQPFIMYTTRPIRAKETDGVQYHFTDVETLKKMQEEGRVIELRKYDTMYGPWYYFSADGESIDLDKRSCLALGTLESYQKMRDYYGADRVLPIYIEVSDLQRLQRSIKREQKQAVPKFSEVCRRYLADEEDFEEEKIIAAGITRRFSNDGEREICMKEAEDFIRENL